MSNWQKDFEKFSKGICSCKACRELAAKSYKASRIQALKDIKTKIILFSESYSSATITLIETELENLKHE